MSKSKKIVLSIIILAFVVIYIAGVSFVIKLIFKPTVLEPLVFGNYNVIDANNEIDIEDEDNNTVYNNINSLLLYNTESELNELKLINLYKIYKEEGVNPDNSEAIILEISESIAKDSNLRLIKLNTDKSIQFIDLNVEKRIREGSDEEYYVIVFDVEEEGYYGLVSIKGQANYDWLIVLISITGFILLYFILFVIIKPIKNGKKDNSFQD